MSSYFVFSDSLLTRRVSCVSILQSSSSRFNEINRKRPLHGVANHARQFPQTRQAPSVKRFVSSCARLPGTPAPMTQWMNSQSRWPQRPTEDLRLVCAPTRAVQVQQSHEAPVMWASLKYDLQASDPDIALSTTSSSSIQALAHSEHIKPTRSITAFTWVAQSTHFAA